MAFIIFEGIDGSGKTSVVRALGNSTNAVVTGEPTQSAIGSLIRSLLTTGLAKNANVMEHLFNADRIWHSQGIARLRQGGAVVLCDRYVGSTIAYQTATRFMNEEPGFDPAIGIDRDVIEDMLRIERESLVDAQLPDLCIFLDVHIDVAMGRLAGRSKLDIYEADNGRTLRWVDKCYCAWIENTDIDVEVVDANLPFDEVCAASELLVKQAIAWRKWFDETQTNNVEKTIQLRRIAKRGSKVRLDGNVILPAVSPESEGSDRILERLGSPDECKEFCHSVGWRVIS